MELTVQASQPGGGNDELTFIWSTSHGRVSGDSLDQDGDAPISASATFDSTGLIPGVYEVTAGVESRTHRITCTIDVTVETN